MGGLAALVLFADAGVCGAKAVTTLYCIMLCTTCLYYAGTLDGRGYVTILLICLGKDWVC